jgi:hypothetical protein
MRKNYYASATPFYFSEDCANASKLRYLLVARAGIEPATHGFSVRLDLSLSQVNMGHSVNLSLFVVVLS